MKNRDHIRSVLARLIAGAVILNLIAFGLVTMWLVKSRQHYAEETRRTTVNLANSLSDNVFGVIDKIGVGLHSTAIEAERQIANGNVDGPSLNAYIERQRAEIRDFEGMWVADEFGNINWGTDIIPGKPVGISDRTYFQKQSQHAGLGVLISEPVMGRVTKAWSILLSRRINKPDGSFGGIALGSLRMVDYFTEKFSPLQIGKDGVIALRDENLALLVRRARTSEGNFAPGVQTMSESGRSKVLDSPDFGVYTTMSAQDGIERVFGYKKVPNYPLYIFVGVSTHEMLKPWRREFFIAALFLIAFCLVTAYSVWITYRRMGAIVIAQEAEERNVKLERSSSQLERGMYAAVSAVSQLMVMRDPYTVGHERRVGEIAAAIAAEMGLDEEYQRGLRVAGSVHDVGKISIPSEILSKPGKLTTLEYEMVKHHPEKGYEILKGIDFPWPVAEVALQHHERLDGHGYPNHLKGNQIILEARILAVADVVEAISSHRPYRPALGIDSALAEIERGSGTAYDAKVVSACLRLFRDKGFKIPD